MSRSGIALLALAVFTAGMAIHGWRETERARAAVIAAENAIFRNVGMDGEMKQIQKHLMAVQRDRDQLRAAIDAVVAGPPVASAAATKASKAGAPVESARLEDELVRLKATRLVAAELLSANPELRRLFLESRRGSLAATYGPLLRTLELTPAQIEQFNELCLQREEQRMDVEELDRSTDSTEKAAGTMVRAEDDAGFRAAQLALLGEKGFQQFQEFERQRPVRTLVTQLAAAAALADLALTPQQGEQLVRVLASASSSYQTGGPADPRQVDWSAVDIDARRILFPDQFTLFTRVEPLGGGPSRFEARLRREIVAADQKDRATIPFR